MDLQRSLSCLFGCLALAGCAAEAEPQGEPSELEGITQELGWSAWVPINWGIVGDEANQRIVSRIAVDAISPGLTYAGTPQGLYVSETFGLFWRRAADVQVEWPTANVGALAVSPTRAGVAYAALGYVNFRTGLALFKTEDRGRSFRLTFQEDFIGSMQELSVAPDDPRVIYGAQFGYTGGHVYRSTDEGETWRQLSPGAECCTDLVAVTSKHVYGLAAYGGIPYETTDGETWHQLAPLSFNELEVDLRRPAELYAVDSELRLRKSTDAGQTWFAPSEDFTDRNVHFVAVSPVDSRVYVIVGDGEARTVYASEDGGETFVEASEGLEQAAVQTITPHPKLRCVAYATSRGAGAFRTHSAGGSCR